MYMQNQIQFVIIVIVMKYLSQNETEKLILLVAICHLKPCQKFLSCYFYYNM